MPRAYIPRIDFTSVPTVWSMLNDDSPIRIIIGPVGSAKTTGCACEVMKRALSQEVGRDGYRHFRAAVIRNTGPQLEATTIPSWLAVFPEDACGPFRHGAPRQHHIKVEPQKWRNDLPVDHPAQGTPGLDLLVMFFALDKPQDVRNLLSFECYFFWFNEVREIPKPIFDQADLRIGRSAQRVAGGDVPTWYGIIGDTNPPDTDHWIYRAERGVNEYDEHVGRPFGWSFYHQPPAVVEMQRDTDGVWKSKPGEVSLVVTNPRHVFEAGGTIWAVNPAAENNPNLPVHPSIDPTMDILGPGSYYGRGVQGKAKDWIVGYLQGKYGFVREGKPVIPEFDVDRMVAPFDPPADVPVIGGSDIGGNTLNPASVLFQRSNRGIYLVRREIVASQMGLARYVEEIKVAYALTYKPAERYPFEALWGDPAGRVKDGIFETVAFDHMIAAGLPAYPAPSQDTDIRIDAIKAPMTRNVDGKPGIIIHPECSKLIQGLQGKWKYKRMNVSGAERYADKPEKTHPYSDVCESLGYGLSGAGETKLVARGNRDSTFQRGTPYNAVVDFNVFGNND